MDMEEMQRMLSAPGGKEALRKQLMASLMGDEGLPKTLPSKTALRQELLAQMMQQQEESKPPNSQHRPSERRRLKARVRQLEREGVVLRRQAKRLASALGACECFGMWGDRCPKCQGKGQPGTDAPDEKAFIRYVLPVLRSLGLVVEGDVTQTEEVLEASSARNGVKENG